MLYNPLLLVVVLVATGVGLLLGYVVQRVAMQRQRRESTARVRQMLQEAEKEAESKKREAALEAQASWYQAKATLEQEAAASKLELQRLEQKILVREEHLERKLAQLEEKENALQRRDVSLMERETLYARKEQELTSLLGAQMHALEQIARMTAAEAKQQLMDRMLAEARAEAAEKVRRIEEEAKELARKRASFYTSLAIQRFAADHVVESSVSVVTLPSEEMKGRIIGREGRNIRAFETATGVDLIIDDTPEAVIISGFDPIRREIARLALERLLADGRIHPGRIEDVVDKVKKEMANTLKEEGEAAAFDVGVEDLHPEIIKLLGRLKYRTSYSQNVLQHVKETAYLAGIMAAELGADERMARRAGLLHDIGKAADHMTQGTHVQIGQEIARRYNEPDVVVNAIGCHHEDEEPRYIEAILVAAADALSAARPGARREMLEGYVKRLQKLEEIGDSFAGVEKTYAIQAGREIRIVVQPDHVSDAEATLLAHDVAKRIEHEMVYPGQIKVTVLR
ncbi:MAG: ribonuclease Y, partial [candidate division KSB1 bacterium]|nr:ribonuclease Y [candidate division KSB1 bacterium]